MHPHQRRIRHATVSQRIPAWFGLVILSAAIGGCAATPLQPGAERVIVARQAPPKSCKFVGAVVGAQGGIISGRYTSNQNLAEGALNDVRNRAHALGANYVSIQSETAGQTGSGSSFDGTGNYYSAQTDVTKTGNAYSCPPKDIGLQ